MRGFGIAAAVLLVAAALLTWNYLRPVPPATASLSLQKQSIIAGPAPVLPWPSAGSAAVGVSGLGLIASSGNEQPIPAASVAKVMTALVVLSDKPLKPGDQGATLAMTAQDVQAYQSDFDQKQSVVEVREGESLTELQLLEGMLIPSANNLAETLARWDSGSVNAFVDAMN